MKVQRVSYFSILSVASIASASLLDFSYDFCDSSSILSSLNPLCERPGISNAQIELPLLHGSPSKPQHILDSSSGRKHHNHNHNHDHLHHQEPQSQWSKPPQCIQRSNASKKYCVYTDTSFASNRGISFLASSTHGPHIHSLEGFTSPSALEGVNHATDPRYASRPIPGKGLGLVALLPIQRGEELFRSTPVLVLEEEGSGGQTTGNGIVDGDENGNGEGLTDEQRIQVYNLASRQLPKRSRAMFDELKGHFGGDPVEDKINTNCFAVELDIGGNSVAATAVFPEMSRMNHDCRPNAHYYFDPTTLIQHVHSLRTILPGEEITISYIDPAQTSSVRKAALEHSWGFPCGCNSCNAPPPIRQASDKRVEEIQRLTARLNDYTPTGKVKDSARQGVHIAELLVELYKMEGLLGPVSEGYAYAALEYSSAMRKWEALRYAHLAVEAGLLYGGPKDADVMGMQELIRNAEGHWSWGVRARKRWEGKQGKQQGQEGGMES